MSGGFSNTTTQLPGPNRNPPTACGQPSCRINIKPRTLSYPTIFRLVEQTQVATVLPVVKVFPNGSRTTVTSTFKSYDKGDGSYQTFVPPTDLTLTWETYGTTLTWPTIYIAYSATLVLQTPTPTKHRNDNGCDTTSITIDIPRTATPQLVFASTNSSVKLPGSNIAFSILDALPTITELLNGGNPTACDHGTPTDPSRTAALQTPNILPQVPISYTTTSILTQVGGAVTFTVPFGDDGGSVPTVNGGGKPGGTDLPQSQEQGTATQGQGTAIQGQGTITQGQGTTSPAGVTKIIVGAETIQQVPSGGSGAIINGQTFTPGQASTLSNGVVVSVAQSTNVVVVDGQTISLAAPTTTTSTSLTTTFSGGPGAAIASGMGISGAAENSGTWLITLEGIVVFALPGVLAML